MYASEKEVISKLFSSDISIYTSRVEDYGEIDFHERSPVGEFQIISHYYEGFSFVSGSNMFKWGLRYQIFSQFCVASADCCAQGYRCLETIMPGFVSEASAASCLCLPGCRCLSVNAGL